MKYPKNQQQVFERFLKELFTIIDVEKINPNTLHYICFQQHSEGQKHNWLYCTVDGLKREHQLTENEDAVKLFDSNFEFELYPDGCNDNHIETMVRRTIKNLTNK